MAERSLIEFVCPEGLEPGELPLPFAGTSLLGRRLVGDVAAGDGAALVELPEGTRCAAATSAPFELIVLEGELDVAGRRLGRYGYLSGIPGEPLPGIAAATATLVFVDCIAGVQAARVLPYSEEGWSPSLIPGLTRRIVRGDLEGARGFFLRIPPGWSERRTEWHDCAEASLVLEGDLWHVRANGGAGGTMRRNCYFWRPRHVLHSPMGSKRGALAWVYVDGRLVNHYLEEGDHPPPSSAG